MNSGENINTIDPDTRADRAKYIRSKGSCYLQEIIDRLCHLAIEERIDAEEFDTLQDLVLNVWLELCDATPFGKDGEDRYSNDCPVSSKIELPVEPSDVRLLVDGDAGGFLPFVFNSDQLVRSFTYTWHPDGEHPSNQRHELTGDEAPGRLYGYTDDGWWSVAERDKRHKLLVTAPGHLDSVTAPGPEEVEHNIGPEDPGLER
jgi:hypothetical protein